MVGLMSTRPWKELNAKLLAAADRDFERAVLPLMRAIWPGMVQVPATKSYDSSGIDLLCFTEDDKIACAVQCKGFFKTEGLADDQFRPIEKSIESFRKSDLHVGTFLLVHNQDGRNHTVASKIDDLLAKLVADGLAHSAEQWDRHKLFGGIQAALWNMVEERVVQHAAQILAQADMNFSLSADIVSNVPLERSSLILRRGSQAKIVHAGINSSEPGIASLLQRPKNRWTLLTGLFGSGKSTACLKAALQAPNRMIYVPASDIEPARGEVGTNVLMQSILKALSIFADFEDDERLVFERLASPMLRKELSANKSDATLIIDGLDENRALAGPAEMTRFASTLAELRCRVVLSTRLEHFHASFGNYDHLFDELSSKGIPKKIPVIHLSQWDWPQIIELVRHASQKAPSNRNLTSFLEKVRKKKSGGWEVELLKHPLFSRMILDLVADATDPTENRSQLISNWIRQKLIRDLKAARETPIPIKDRDDFLHLTNELMVEVAALMTESDSATDVQLVETIDSEKVIESAERIYRRRRIPLHSITGTSLLVPIAARYRKSVPMRFSHRAFQEYFLALHLQYSGKEAGNYPEAVRGYLAGIHQLD